MYFKRKYFIFFIVLLVALMGLASAADADDYTQTQTSYTSTGSMATDTHENIEANINNEDTSTLKKCNVPLTNENNNIKSQNNSLNNQEQNNNFETDTTLLQKKSSEKVKTESNENVTTITEDNYNDYLSISSSGKATLNRNYFVAGKNYTINFTYFPTEANKFEVKFYSNSYKNDNLKLVGNGITINNTNFIINKEAFNSIVLEDMVLNYSPEYMGDYVNITSATLNNVTINVDTQRETFSIPLTVSGEKSLVENCTINANVPSTQIDWYTPNIPRMPKGVGVWIKSNNVTLANNVIYVNESKVETGNESYYRSLYGIYSSGSYTTLRNNTFLLNGTQYSYGIVVRSLNNLISSNNITVVSEYYAAGINVEGEGISNNLMCNNFINVSAGFGVTDQGNPDVAYACLILDFSCGGENYVASYRSMCNNSYINNTVICDGRQVYGFELWGGVNTTISGNNLTVTGTLPLGIGAIGINTTMDNNIIFAEGTSNSTEGSADYIKPRTAGIYAFGMKEGNTITNNTIAVTNGRALRFESAKNMLVENNFLLSEDYAYVIEVDNINNTFRYNAIIGDGTTDEVIRDTNRNDNTYINNREATNSSLTISAPESILVNVDTNITISLNDDEGNSVPNQYVQVQMDEESQTYITDEKGTINIPISTAKPKTVQVTAEYECYGDYGSTSTKQIKIIEPIVLTPENFNTYITGGLLNDNVPSGATIDMGGKFDGERYAFNITKPVNIYSSNGDAFLCFYSIATSESGSELPHNSFVIADGGSGTNITSLYFENTEILVLNAHDVTFDNLTVYCTEGYGWGRGSTSIRNSDHVTIKNSYFNTTDNNGVSTLVFAASQDSLVENCTVTGSGFIGNLVYATTYNVEVEDQYGNNNITIRNNKIIGRNLMPGVATCYSVCVVGDNITVENNYIENSNDFLIMTQYKDDDYEVEGDTGSLIIRNNSFSKGKISVNFDPCIIENNIFYGNVTLDVTNNTITQNNTVKAENLNPYKNTTQSSTHPTSINIDAPEKYWYDEEITINITVKDETTGNNLSHGFMEIYADGYLYKNITLNSPVTSFKYSNSTIGTHRIRAWYYSQNEEIADTQKLATTEASAITGKLTLTCTPTPHIGDNVTLTATYTLDKQVNLKTNITFNLPGQDPITVEAKNNAASINTTITTDYIRDILGGREQSVKVTATTENPNVQITELSTKLGVQKAITNITITPHNTLINKATLFTATITTPTGLTINTGTITFTDTNGNTITSNVENNRATATITFNNAGTTQITTTYTETTYFATTTTTTDITVNKQNTTITLDTINQTQKDTNITINGKLTTTDATGLNNENINIQINNNEYTVKTANDGTYTLSIITDQIGTNNITVTYNGNSRYNPASTNTTFNVIDGKENVIITIDTINDVAMGDNVTIMGKFTKIGGNPISGANLKVSINGAKFTVKTDKKGTYTLSQSADTPGTNNVTVSYAGNSKYNPSESSTTFTVTGDTPKQNPTITINNIEPVNLGTDITISGTLKNPKGNALTNVNIKININGITTSVKTDKNGKYSLAVVADTAGTNNVTVSYAGNSKYYPASATTTYTVTQDTSKQNPILTVDSIENVKLGDTITIRGTFKNPSGKALTSANLKISINGIKTAVKTDKNGTYSLTITANTTGDNNIVVIYTGNSKYNPTRASTSFTIKQDTQITINPINNAKINEPVTITGTLKNDQNKALSSANIKVTLNGITSTVKTDKNGAYTLTTTNTIPGTNNITVTYAGNNKFNKSTTTSTFAVKT